MQCNAVSLAILTAWPAGYSMSMAIRYRLANLWLSVQCEINGCQLAAGGWRMAAASGGKANTAQKVQAWLSANRRISSNGATGVAGYWLKPGYEITARISENAMALPAAQWLRHRHYHLAAFFCLLQPLSGWPPASCNGGGNYLSNPYLGWLKKHSLAVLAMFAG